MFLSAVGLTAATVYLLESVGNCWTSCKSSRTLPLVLSQDPEDQNIWQLSYEIFIGYRFDSESCSKQPFWCTSASTAWFHSTFRNTASRCHLSSAATVNPRTLVDWLFYEPGRITATAVSQYRDVGHENSLPTELRAPDILLETFRHKLKTFSFTV